MLNVYVKSVRKQWLTGSAPPLLVALIVPMIASIWPEMKAQAELWIELLQNPIYKAMLGDLVDMSTWSGFYFMYIFVWLEWIMMFITIFVPARIISREVNKNTLDVMLSYPISRWRFVLEKFSVYLTYNLLYPIILLFVTYLYTNSMNETMNYTTLAYSLIGVWLLFFALGAISLLCGAIFLDRAVSAAGVIILGQYLFKSIGQLQDSLATMKDLSLFSYLNSGYIADLGRFPWGEAIIVAGVGLLALLGALYIFQKRELAY